MQLEKSPSVLEMDRRLYEKINKERDEQAKQIGLDHIDLIE